VIREISGRHNHTVKLARKLQDKKNRRARGVLVAEGLDLLRAAVAAGVAIQDVLVRRDLQGELPIELVRRAEQTDPSHPGGPHVGVCDADTLAHASLLGGSADVIFIAPEPAWNLSDVDLAKGLAVYLDQVGDPGNVGTLVRSCVAFGAIGVVCSPGTADPYSPKALRAGMGAQFIARVITEVSPADLKAKLRRLRGGSMEAPVVLVAEPCLGDDVGEVSVDAGAVLVLGAERTGPSDDWGGGHRITIPQKGFDSLNVAMAGTVLLYELTRHAAGRGGS
jgi:TrmH family RNA methyltransferase